MANNKSIVIFENYNIRRSFDGKTEKWFFSVVDIVVALAEMSTRHIAENMRAVGMEKNKSAGKQGGGISKKARVELEKKTNKKVVSGKNFLESKGDKKRLK